MKFKNQKKISFTIISRVVNLDNTQRDSLGQMDEDSATKPENRLFGFDLCRNKKQTGLELP